MLRSKNQLPKLHERLSYDSAFSGIDSTPENVVMQHTQYFGKTFKWIAHNDPGYCMYIARDYQGRSFNELKHEREKFSFRLSEYALSSPLFKKTHDFFKERADIDLKAEASGQVGSKMVGFGAHSDMTYIQLYESKDKEHMSYVEWVRKIQPRGERNLLAQLKEFVKKMNLKNKPISA